MSQSIFEKAPFIPPDPIFELGRKYLADGFRDKVNVGPGTYRDANGLPWVLPAVEMAKKKISGSGHEYLQITGLKEFRESAVDLFFGQTKAFKEQRIASCQSISGTGSLFLAAMLLQKLPHCPTNIYITDPSWPNHDLMFRHLGFNVHKIDYYNDHKFDFSNYIETLESAPKGSAVVLHACAHNPTGCDPTKDQWKEIARIVQARGLFPIFDAAYLGFNSGSLNEDSWAINHFIEELGLESAVGLSFAKSMGLYGERTGLVAFITSSKEQTRNVMSLLENVQRATVSSPPAYGARIATAVMSDSEIREQWMKDLLTMSGRIRAMRVKLYNTLTELVTPGDWSHIIQQTGMFGYLGLTSEQVVHLQSKYHIYMTSTSRISLAGLNESNIAYFARAIHDTVQRRDLEL